MQRMYFMELEVKTMAQAPTKCVHCKKLTTHILGVRLKCLCESCYSEWFKLRDKLVEAAFAEFSGGKNPKG